MVPRSYTTIARQYARSVVTGKVSTSKWVQLACQRQIAIPAGVQLDDVCLGCG